MNTVRSTWYGWATLCVAGGGAYYFAKRQINEDRASKYNRERVKQERLRRLEYSGAADHNDSTSSQAKPSKKSLLPGDDLEPALKSVTSGGTGDGDADTTREPARSRSKYEGEPFKSKRGDRFS